MESTVRSRPLSEGQLMVLQIVKNMDNEQDLNELRDLLLEFNNRKMQEQLEKVVAEKGYTDADFEDMLNGHMRKTR
jgi:hypothetical protein